LALEGQLAELPGAAHVETSLKQDVPISIPNVADPIIGRLIGLDARTHQRLNKVALRRGTMPAAHQSGAIEVLVSEGFAIARQLHPGDRIHALINGKREELLIVGLALSPEYIFAGLVGSPDQRGFGVFWLDRQALAAACNMEGAFNQIAVRLAPGAIEGPIIDGLNRLLAPYGGSSAHGRDQQMSDVMLSSEIKQQKAMGTVLPSIFLAVAGFLLNVVLSRQIATQREQIAALKALGYHNRAIASHYLSLVLLIVALGVGIGIALGAWLGHSFMGLYAEAFRFPTLAYRVKPVLLLAAVGVAVLAAVLATLFAIRDTVQLAPAEAMRPPAPGNFKPMLLERWGLQHWLSPAARMVVRTMERRPLRTGLTIFGIAAAMAIVITGAFWRDAIGELFDNQFQQVWRGDVSLSLIEVSPARVLHELARLPHVTAVEGTRSLAVKLLNANHQWRGAIQGKPSQPELLRVIGRGFKVLSPVTQACCSPTVWPTVCTSRPATGCVWN
jgi:putative ABC transport system permease protein